MLLSGRGPSLCPSTNFGLSKVTIISHYRQAKCGSTPWPVTMPLRLVGGFPFSELCSTPGRGDCKWGQGHPSLQGAKPRLKRFHYSTASQVSAVGINSEAPRETQGRPRVSRIHEAFSVFCCRSNSSSRCPLDHRKETTATRQHRHP